MSRQNITRHGKPSPGAPPPGRPPANGSGRDLLGRLRATIESLRHQLSARRRNREHRDGPRGP